MASGTVGVLATSSEDLRAIARRVRAEAEAAGELARPKVGKARWDVPEVVREALLEDLTPRTGARCSWYWRLARALAAPGRGSLSRAWMRSRTRRGSGFGLP